MFSRVVVVRDGGCEIDLSEFQEEGDCNCCFCGVWELLFSLCCFTPSLLLTKLFASDKDDDGDVLHA
jgi:hypothetical protein